MKQNLTIGFLFVLILALPFVFRKEQPVIRNPDVTVVVITPHPESIRQEFARGFVQWYRERTGLTARVDYRVIGGTGEIARFLNSEYLNSFRLHWERDLGRRWTRVVQDAAQDHRIELPADPALDTEAQAARRAYLASNASSGIDVFFGGGVYDFSMQARRGNLVDGGLFDLHPDWFMPTAEPGQMPPAIPGIFAGERFFDDQGRWYGAVLSSYGIIFNRDSLSRLGIEREPEQWVDLMDPRFFGEIALCDPTKSGSMTQAFEMIIQQQMQLRLNELLAEHPDASEADFEAQAVADGWMRGMQIIQIISANARYFTDTSQKPNIDVAAGDSAAGMSIDFFGRFQQESILERSGSDRFGINIPIGGTTISADPIGLLRGAPNRDVAVAFLEFVLSHEGQKLWNFRVGTPGGPTIFPLRRTPIRPSVFDPQYTELRSDPTINPFIDAKDFRYRAEWTSPLFSEIRTLIRVCFIDVRNELVAAWGAILRAREEGRTEDAERAFALFSDLSLISHQQTVEYIQPRRRSSRLEEVRISRDLSRTMRAQYIEARRIAEGRRS
ncbi:MAG: ABC transporter substrate-binding protein [Verrucomicrobia bacterium]|nr:ABC transporter substrate-binding protein [Verrucomicrobiota bacterium]